MLRGVRGATTVEENGRDQIFTGVAELLTGLVKENNIRLEDVGAVIFSSTPDINAAFPAAGARAMGWSEVPLFGTLEIDNPEGVARCIRVLILWNTQVPQHLIKHLYLKGAAVLRQDLTS